MFVNQLYPEAQQRPIEQNPDLQAIRIASVNPILDPWIYILLKKTVVLKLLEKIKCLFCRIGGRSHGRSHVDFRCSTGGRNSSIASRDLPSLVMKELPETICTSQTYLYFMEGGQGMSCCGHSVQSGSCSTPTEQTLLCNSMASDLSCGDSSGRTDGREQSTDSHLLAHLKRDEAQHSKHQPLQVTLTDENPNLQERCI